MSLVKLGTNAATEKATMSTPGITSNVSSGKQRTSVKAAMIRGAAGVRKRSMSKGGPKISLMQVGSSKTNKTGGKSIQRSRGMGHMHHMKARKNSNGSFKGGIPSIEHARKAFMTVESRDNPSQSPLRLPKLKYGNRKPSL